MAAAENLETPGKRPVADWLATWGAQGPNTSSRLPSAVLNFRVEGAVWKDTEMASVLYLICKRCQIAPAQTNGADPFLKGP